MPISGTLVASDTFPAYGPPASAHTDPITLSTALSAGDWLILVQLGGYPWGTGVCTPPNDELPVSNIVFGDLSSSAFAFNAPPPLTPQWNEAVGQLGYVSNFNAVCPDSRTTAYVDDTYPNLAYSAPGLLASPVASGDTMDIDWGAGERRWEAYAAFLARVDAPFDQDGFGEAIWLGGSNPDSSGSTLNIASGTTSPVETTHAASAAAAGHGAIAITAIAWDDTSQLPTITAGWTMLAHYADTTTGWAGLLAGRVFPDTDTSVHTVNATFASAVKSESVIDTWQASGSEEPGVGYHGWVRVGVRG